jgi:hypothetical protein
VFSSAIPVPTSINTCAPKYLPSPSSYFTFAARCFLPGNFVLAKLRLIHPTSLQLYNFGRIETTTSSAHATRLTCPPRSFCLSTITRRHPRHFLFDALTVFSRTTSPRRLQFILQRATRSSRRISNPIQDAVGLEGESPKPA